MLINFPNQLTSEEEQLLKKIAKMKKKKKLFSEKKSLKESQTTELQPTNLISTASGAVKRPSSNIMHGKQIDAKEAAKKLIKSGAIKFETENKDKGFKRSSSRKDDTKLKGNLNIISEPISEQARQISYSSVTSPSSAQSPPVSANSSYYSSSKFSFSSGDSQKSPYSQSPSYPSRNTFRKNTFQHNQTPNSSLDQAGYNSQPRFQNNQQYNYGQQQQNQQTGVSLFIKANNVTEDLLRSLLSANVSQAKVISIDVKTNFAFVTVDTKEAAENAIQELNGKTFQESLFSVSLARPRKTFNRNSNYPNTGNRGGYYNQKHNFSIQNQSNQPFGSSDASPLRTSASGGDEGSDSAQSSNVPRQLINYEDV